jgi:hypothetical protein
MPSLLKPGQQIGTAPILAFGPSSLDRASSRDGLKRVPIRYTKTNAFVFKVLCSVTRTRAAEPSTSHTLLPFPRLPHFQKPNTLSYPPYRSCVGLPLNLSEESKAASGPGRRCLMFRMGPRPS